jgi:hypothetical protein
MGRMAYWSASPARVLKRRSMWAYVAEFAGFRQTISGLMFRRTNE